MDAAAHLRAQGWQGPGNGLRAGSLQRAILTSKKTDLKGLGAKTNESDQWWDNIFSKQLGNITVGAKGVVGQVNGGIKAAHPIAARNAHRRQFGEKSALEKVFTMGEVLKGSEVFIPLTPRLAKEVVEGPSSTKRSKSSKPKSDGDSSSSKHVKVVKEEHVTRVKADGKRRSSVRSRPIANLIDSTTRTEQLSRLSDKVIRKEARRLRRESRAAERAAKAERKETRRIKRVKRQEKELGDVDTSRRL